MGQPTITISLTADDTPEPLAAMTLPMPTRMEDGCPVPDDEAMLDRLRRGCKAFANTFAEAAT